MITCQFIPTSVCLWDSLTDRCRFTSSTLCFRLRDLFVVSSFTQKSFKNYNEKSAQRRRKHCALAVVRRSQNFSPRRRPPSRARDGQNLISWRWSLSLPTNPIWSMHAISSYRGNRPTHTHPPTHRQDWLQYTAPQLARSVPCSILGPRASLIHGGFRPLVGPFSPYPRIKPGRALMEGVGECWTHSCVRVLLILQLSRCVVV